MKMKLSRKCAVLAFTMGGLLICIEPTAADMDTEVRLNRQWALQMFSSEPDDAQPVSRLVIAHEDVAGDTRKGRCAAGGPIRLGNKTYTHGIGVNSHSVMRVMLIQPAKKFVATIGIDRHADNTPASVRFHVAVGGKDKFATDVMRAGADPVDIDVPLEGAKEFELMVDHGGDSRGWDQADWADAKVVLEDGSEVWLDALSDQAPVKPHLPFSFVYAGRHSSEFMDRWKRQVVDEKLDKTKTRRTITLTDPLSHLEVRAVCTMYVDTPGTVLWAQPTTGCRQTSMLPMEDALASLQPTADRQTPRHGSTSSGKAAV